MSKKLMPNVTSGLEKRMSSPAAFPRRRLTALDRPMLSSVLSRMSSSIFSSVMLRILSMLARKYGITFSE